MSSLEGLSHPAPQAQAGRSTGSHNGGKAGLYGEWGGGRTNSYWVGRERERSWMIMWKCTALFINTQALQLHMLALDTHAHVSLLQVAARTTRGTEQLYATIRSICRVCMSVCEVTEMEVVKGWYLSAAASKCRNLSKTATFLHQRSLTFLVCVSTKVLHHVCIIIAASAINIIWCLRSNK